MSNYKYKIFEREKGLDDRYVNWSASEFSMLPHNDIEYVIDVGNSFSYNEREVLQVIGQILTKHVFEGEARDIVVEAYEDD